MIGHGFLLETAEIAEQQAMSEILGAIAVNIPTAIAVIYVVSLFLKAQTRWNEDLKKTSENCNKVIDRNTEVFGELKSSLGEFSGVIQKCKKGGD